MSQIIDQLATIEISNEALQQLNVENIYQSFTENYRKLDNLKNYRSEHENKNFLMRWWHNDKLRAAQLDSVEVQAEFSKTIGQLMVLSIMQSRRLYDQQTRLNEQQTSLKTQADGIAEHADNLQKQHQVLAEQSEKLETLVHEYFELKGLTENSFKRLIEIVNELKTSKESMLHEFSRRAHEVENQCSQMSAQMDALTTQVSKQIQVSVGQNQANMTALQKETQKKLAACAIQQATYHAAQVQFEKDTSCRLNRIMLIIALISAIIVITIFGTACILFKWI